MSNIVILKQSETMDTAKGYLTREEMMNDLERVLAIEAKIIAALFSNELSTPDVALTPIGQDFDRLHHFIHKRRWQKDPARNRVDVIHEVIGFLERVASVGEWDMAGGITAAESGACDRLRMLAETAEALRCLEEDEEITLAHARLLTGMSEASIRNAASKGQVSFYYIDAYPGEVFLHDGSMPVSEWIRTRSGFRQPPTELSDTNSETVNVPYASDGTYFSPTCRMRQGYQVGKRGGKGVMKQRYFSDYWSALEALEKMDRQEKAYWRRPSQTSGVPGTVTGRAWGKVERSKIEKLLDTQ